MRPPKTPKSKKSDQKRVKTPATSTKKQADPHISQEFRELNLVEPTKLSLARTSAGLLSSCPCVFTKDSKFFFCGSGSSVRMISCQTGNLFKSFSSIDDDGHTQAITRMVLNPFNPLQLYTCSLDGTIRLWDFTDGVMLKKWDVGYPVANMCCSSRQEHLIYAYYRVPGDDESCKVIRFDLKSNISSAIHALHRCNSITLSGDEDYLIVGSNSKFFTFDVNNDYVVKGYESNHRITTVVAHPTEHIIAVGDELGRIVLHYFKQEKVVQTVLHWHAHAVSTLAFSADGNYIVSGGEESVLVLWQLETRSKDFLPRMGSPITTISQSPDQSLYAVGHLDNTVRIVYSANFSMKQAVVGLKGVNNDTELHPFSSGLQIHPGTKNIVLPSIPGNIQFYHYETDQHVSELEVVPTNRVSRIQKKKIAHPHVRKIAFSKNGKWMLTVDTRVDSEYKEPSFLKFWSVDGEKSITLNTRVENPHNGSITSAVATRFEDVDIFATTSSDGTFKIWTMVTEDEESFWACRSTGFFRSLPANSASFSKDGSLFAVPFGNTITLWHPLTNVLKATLLNPLPETYQEVQFLQHYVIARTKEYIQVWNVLSCSILWSVKVSADLLAINEASKQLAFYTKIDKTNAMVYICDVKSPFPIGQASVDSSVVGMLLEEDMRVILLTKEFQLLQYSTKPVNHVKQANRYVLETQEQVDVITKLYGGDMKKIKSHVPEHVSTTKVAFLEMPSYMLPSPSKLAIPHLESMLSLNEAVPESREIENDSMDVDEAVVPTQLI